MPRPRDAAAGVAETSQRLIEVALAGDLMRVEEALEDRRAVDVNHVGTVKLKLKCSEAVVREERPDEVRIGFVEFPTDVTALFVAAHCGHRDVVRKLLSAGADVNQKVFHGYASTAASREGHCDILSMLLKAGTSPYACEDALMEASLFGEVQAVKLLICSDMPRPDAAAHALVTASCRGFTNVVIALIQSGVDMNCMNRVLLRSVKPALHANVDCTPLTAAVVARQIPIVKYLLKAGARIDCKTCVGAWSWDPVSGDEVRVGACLGEPYNAAWCGVEYYESSGEILKLLLHHQPQVLENPHLGRTLLCHAILCHNVGAVGILLDFGASTKFPLKIKNEESHPLHLAARVGTDSIVKLLISHNCDVNAMTKAGETALMIAARADDANCFLQLLIADADLGVVSNSGDTVIELAKKSAFASSVIDILCQALAAGSSLYSSEFKVFSPLHFAAASGNLEFVQMVMRPCAADINKLDCSGLTPAMIAVNTGCTDLFDIFVMAGADLSLKSPDGKSVVSLIKSVGSSASRNHFEQILLKAVLANVLTDHSIFNALHHAARIGDSPALIQLLKMGFPVNSVDEYGYSPLMYAAIEGHVDSCKTLLMKGNADCRFTNSRGETALSLVRNGSSRSSKIVEGVLLDHQARSHVLEGEALLKHTREGKGAPHTKMVRMLKSGVLTWGRSSRRNVKCKDSSGGPSLNFLKNQRVDGVVGDKRRTIFRVNTVTGRQVHFEAGSSFNLELWVRGVNLVAKEAASGA